MSAGTYIWQGLKPCFKMLFTIACGFVLTKKGLFPPAASKGLSQLTMNVALPCLIFSSMVPRFNSSNIANFGPLAMIAILYQFIGCFLILICREIFYVPKDFQWGIILLGSLSNWGNFPLAVASSVATQKPFDPNVDPELGLAYISIFIMVMNTTLYGTGLYKVIAWDFQDDLEEVPRTFSGRMARRRRQFRQLRAWYRQRMGRAAKAPATPAANAATSTADPEKDVETPFPTMTRLRTDHADMEAGYLGGSEIQLARENDLPFHGSTENVDKVVLQTKRQDQPRQRASEADNGHRTTVSGAIMVGLKGLMTPPTLSLLVSLPFALVGPLKALFVESPGWSGTRIPYAPDDQPPLSFFYDFTVFLAGLVIPAGLVILGASFARLKVSKKRFKEMPLGAMLASTLSKMLLMPIIGISIVVGFRNHTTLFPKDQKMLSFVAFLLSGTPSAVNQLVVTQIFAKEGQTTDTLASFLIVQYALLLLQCAALTAISLYLVS